MTQNPWPKLDLQLRDAQDAFTRARNCLIGAHTAVAEQYEKDVAVTTARIERDQSYESDHRLYLYQVRQAILNRNRVDALEAFPLS